MCDFEEFLFDCGHSEQRLKSYCHFARNDPHHQCFGVKKLRDVWSQRTLCEACITKHYQRQQGQWAAYGACHSTTQTPANNNSSSSVPGSGKSSRRRH